MTKDRDIKFTVVLFFFLSIPAAIAGIFLIYASHVKREAVLSACSQADFLKTFPTIMSDGETAAVPAFHHDPSFKKNNFNGLIECRTYDNDMTLKHYTVTVSQYNTKVFSVSAIADSRIQK